MKDCFKLPLFRIIVFVVVCVFALVYVPFSHVFRLLRHSCGGSKSLVAKATTATRSSKVALLNAKRFAESTGNSGCIGGHIAHLHPICGADGCLGKQSAPDSLTSYPVPDPGQLKRIMRIAGWTNPIHLSALHLLSRMQWEHGVFGSVGEIGLHHGGLATVLALNALPFEQLFFADIFEQQHLNIDKSGRGDRAIFLRNMRSVGVGLKVTKETPKAMKVWEDSSLYLSKAVFRRFGLSSFRLFSIDGGHTLATVSNDIRLVLCVLREGGIIAFDDVFNNHKPEVTVALRFFFKSYAGVVKPLLFLENKLYVTTSKMHQKYTDYIKNKILPQTDWSVKFQRLANLGANFSYFHK